MTKTMIPRKTLRLMENYVDENWDTFSKIGTKQDAADHLAKLFDCKVTYSNVAGICHTLDKEWPGYARTPQKYNEKVVNCMIRQIHLLCIEFGVKMDAEFESLINGK